ncbi:unnamed protein product [Vitrella brassicaformis CCMP3155]|uniref:Uncharacterized protein n=1 Tax=Vitrella brassicaformis (strain CCMP3155) TaxID=1169540 RepID=A0A0G4EXA8_VITBC|nr:unnamed protein product [Vitrella brassicaformis CCMP3155]|eukprot:CEM03316.1 unnamed protein product [Vitrella brassicaformis CCMP3155]
MDLLNPYRSAPGGLPVLERKLLEEEAAKFGAAITFTTGAAQDHYSFPGPQAIEQLQHHPPPAVCGVPKMALPVLPACYVPPLGTVEMFKFTSTQFPEAAKSESDPSMSDEDLTALYEAIPYAVR